MTVRFGIVGLGAIAELHAEAIAATDGARLVACAARSPEKAAGFAERHGCDVVAGLDALLARPDVDALVITTPSGTHADMGVRAARAAKHVLCEKPLDLSLDAIDGLIDECERAGVLLGGIFQGRFGAGAQALRRALDAGRFGRLVQCSAHVPWFRSDEYYASAAWRGTVQGDGGALLNQGIHAVDLLTWLAGDVSEVSARVQTRTHDIEAEDNAVAWLQFAAGGLGVVQCSTGCYPGDGRRLEIRGERGSVTLVDDVPTLWEFAEPEPGDDQMCAGGVAAAAGASEPGTIPVDGHLAQYRDFVDAIGEGRESSVPGHEARRSVQLVRAMHESSATASVVRITADAPRSPRRTE